MKLKFHIPTQQYGFAEVEGTEKDVDKMEKLYNKYAEVPLNFNKKKGEFEKIKTFTGETILYNDITHVYTDLAGNKLVSGSEYKRLLDKPFDLEKISGVVSKKHGVDQKVIKDMWSHNSQTSLHFGNAIHWSMEQWFKFKEAGEPMEGKDYHLPKHPFLQEVVLSFPRKEDEILPEVVVSDVANKRVGRVDALLITGKNKCKVLDYKSDANIDEKSHYKQLSFYAHILMNKGWEVEGIEVWNYTDSWTNYQSPVLELIK